VTVDQTTALEDQFWVPEFEYEHRADGTVLMRQKEELPEHMPLLADYLDKWAKATPDQTWIARRGEDGEWIRITYGEARTKARAIGAALLEMGLGADRPLLILSENSLEHALLGVSCAYVGIPYAPISPAYSLVSEGAAKANTIVGLLNPGAIFADDGAVFEDALAVLVRGDCKAVTARNHTADARTFGSLLDHDPNCADTARAALRPDTVVKYLFTSGSTGEPKAVINTNRMICAMQAMVRDCYRFLETEPPVVLNWAPWNHTAAGNKTSYLVLTNGGTYYIDDGRPVSGAFDETLRNLREISCSWYFNVPIGYDMLVKELEKDADLARTFYSNLKMLFYAGAGMAQHTWDRLMQIGKDVTGRDILLATGLGATETAPFALAWTERESMAGNVGVPSRGLTLKLVPSEGKLEARLKGPSITPGYFGDAVKTAEVFDDEGYYCLGDALRPADPEDFSRGFFFDGRVAENFKLSTGTWVSVGAVRAKLVDAMGGVVRDAVIVGENEAQLAALLWLSDSAHQMSPADLDQVLSERLTAAAQAATGSASRVRRAVLLPHAPNLDKGEITEKGSLNQRALRTHYADAIAQMYQSDSGVYTS
jgi:feruloyl-CoA synthase